MDDKCVIPGGGSFEIAAHCHLIEFSNSVQGKAKMGITAFAESLLVIPKTLAENSGYDVQEIIIDAIHKYK